MKSKRSYLKKLASFFFLIFLTLPTVSAVYVQDPILVQPSSYSSYVTLGSGNYSEIGVITNYLIVNQSFKFNSSSNITLTNISYNSDILNFTGAAVSGILNLSLKMLNSDKLYYMRVNNISKAFKTSNSSGWVEFNYSSWSINNFSVTSIPYLYTLSGYVYNVLGVVLQNARVDISGTYNLTNVNGYYEFSNIIEGEHIALARAIGYRNTTNTTTISGNTTINFTLKEKGTPVKAPGFEGTLLLGVILILFFFVSKGKLFHRP